MSNKMTRKEALEFAIDNIAANCMGDMEKTGANIAIDILDKMIQQIDKQSARPKSKTSARTQNEQYAIMFIAAIRAVSKPVNAKWIAEHVNGVMTPQRAVHVAKIAAEWGAIKEVEIKKRKYYEFIQDWQGCEDFRTIAAKIRR